MSLDILSDHDAWVAVAYIDNGDGTVTLRPEARAYVVFGSMSVGLPDLDEKTADEWLTRLRAWEIVDGPMLLQHDPEADAMVGVPVTMDALRPFFGTRTNAFPATTRAAFSKRVAAAIMERAAKRPTPVKTGE